MLKWLSDFYDRFDLTYQLKTDQSIPQITYKLRMLINRDFVGAVQFTNIFNVCPFYSVIENNLLTVLYQATDANKGGVANAFVNFTAGDEVTLIDVIIEPIVRHRRIRNTILFIPWLIFPLLPLASGITILSCLFSLGLYVMAIGLIYRNIVFFRAQLHFYLTTLFKEAGITA